MEGHFVRIHILRLLGIGIVTVPFFIMICSFTLLPTNAEPQNQSAGLIKLPDGFSHEPIVSGLTVPVDMDVLPSGDLLIVEKGLDDGRSTPAKVLLLHEPNGTATLESLLSFELNAHGDSGLLTVLVDPNFEQNHYFYLWHTTIGGAYKWQTIGASKYRLTRLTLDTITRKIVPNSKLVIIDNIPRSYYHAGGGISFNSQGNLFIAIGDAWNSQWTEHVSQDLSSPLGKVLRIRPTESGYVIPAGNPFAAHNAAMPEIYALGLRNPFRMVQRPTDDAIFVGDVGGDVWEELNRVRPTANYGWPIREGPCLRGQRLPCDSQSSYRNPDMFYVHPPDAKCCTGGSISGLAFYAGKSFPQGYHNQLFVADYNHQFIAAIDPDTAGLYAGPHFAENAGALTDIEYFDERLYLLDIKSGSISRISYYGDKSPPTAVVTSDSMVGAAPLRVQLDGGQSTSGSDSSLSYEWHLNDGSASRITQAPTIEHTFEADGDYQVELVVIDSEMRRSPTATLSVSVYSGDMPQIKITHSDLISRTQFHGGDEFTFSSARPSGAADLNTDKPFTWDLVLHHNQHIHPIRSNLNVISDTLTIPHKNHGGPDIWYEIGLTMHTIDGQAIRVTEELRPEYTQFSVSTEPPISGMSTLDGHPFRFPKKLDMIVDVVYTLEMPETVINGGRVYHFDRWTDAATRHTLVQKGDKPLARAIIASTQVASVKATYIELDQRKYLPFMTHSEEMAD